jgi:hypothetical protein
MDKTIDMAREVKMPYDFVTGEPIYIEKLKAFEALVRADEREAIKDEWWMCVQSDLEHGVKSLNENAAKDFNKNYPEIAKFGAWLEARGNT